MPSPEELGRVYQADLAINVGMPPPPSVDGAGRRSAGCPPGSRTTSRAACAPTTSAWHDAGAARRRASTWRGRRCTCATRLPPDAIVTNGAGNYTRLAAPLLPATAASARSSRRPAAPWATACRRRSRPRPSHPDRTGRRFAGDGCFLMTGQELATAVQSRLPIIVVVVDNGMYGTIRMHQERAVSRAASPAPTLHEPRLRRPGPVVRRPRRAGDGGRRLRPGAGACARCVEAGAAPPGLRPPGDHACDNARRTRREVLTPQVVRPILTSTTKGGKRWVSR